MSSDSVKDIFRRTLNVTTVRPSDTFVQLGGDSLTYVDLSFELERLLGSLPDRWEHRSISDLEKRAAKRRESLSIPTDVLFRAMAIIMVVAFHAGYNTYGGNYFLILLAGINAARFYSHSLFNGEWVRIAKGLFSRVVLPYYLVLFSYQIYKGRFALADWILFSNYVERDWGYFLGSYWFIQALVQCIAFIAGLFLIPWIRRYAKTRPSAFGILLLGLALMMRFVASLIWADKSYLPYTMPMVFYLFSLGWCIHYAQSHWQRIAVTGLLLVLIPLFCNHTLPIIGVSLIGSLLVIWKHRIKIPRFLHLPISRIAAAVFYIYLIHGLPVHLLTRTLQIGSPLLATVLGVVSGMLAWQFVRSMIRWRHQRLGIQTGVSLGNQKTVGIEI